METGGNPSILLISAEPWRGSLISKHHYALTLARRGFNVYYLNPPVDGLKGICVKSAGNNRSLFIVDSPVVARGLRFYPGWLRQRLEAIWLKRLETIAGAKIDAIWLFENSRFFDMSFAGNRLKIYHQVDQNQDFQPETAAKTADICFSTTDFISRRLQPYNARVYKIQHGVSISDALPDLPENLKSKFRQAKAHIGYAGNLDIPYLDVQLLSGLVKSHPEALFHFVGRYNKDGRLYQACSGAANVIWWAQVESALIPAILKRCDILLVTYLAEIFREQLANPHKMMEYLASGKTIVATYTDEYRDRRHLLEMVDDARDFPQAFDKVVEHLDEYNSEEKRRVRIEYAMEHSYDRQLDKVMALLKKHGLDMIHRERKLGPGQGPKVAIFLYNRFFDPLIQSAFWLYINDYLEDPDNNIRFHLVSYEDKRFRLFPEQLKKAEQWRRQGFEWTRLRWHPGLSLVGKSADFCSGLSAMTALRLKGFRHIMAHCSGAGIFAYLYARLLGMKLFLYSYEPHSEYAIDNGMWTKNGFWYKICNFFERRQAEYATVIISGTSFMRQRLKSDWKINGEYFQIPVAANDRKFNFDQKLRNETRKELGIAPEQWVLFYPGKFGSLYYYKETALMYRWLRELEPKLHFLIVTPNSDREVVSIFDSAGVVRGSYSVVHCDYPDIQRYYFASDFAVVTVPPGPSKKFISNIKVGEYLCAGLPFLIVHGISEDYLYAEKCKVGVVVDDFRETDIKKAWPKIKGYLEMDSGERRQHCRSVGLEYRGFDKLNIIFKSAVCVFLAKGSGR